MRQHLYTSKHIKLAATWSTNNLVSSDASEKVYEVIRVKML